MCKKFLKKNRKSSSEASWFVKTFKTHNRGPYKYTARQCFTKTSIAFYFELEMRQLRGVGKRTSKTLNLIGYGPPNSLYSRKYGHLK